MKVKISRLKRAKTAYLIIGKNFGQWFSPILTGLLINSLGLAVSVGLLLDKLFFPKINNRKIISPIWL